MKRIRCPKCDEPITFDNSLYAPGRTLVFECPACRKQFKIRVNAAASGSAAASGQEEEKPAVAYLTVLENAFHFRQHVPLREGENLIGKHVRGTRANAPIKTVDPSVDPIHCVITVKCTADGTPQFVLRDGPSGTGTFLQNEILGDRDRVSIEDGAIITLGATTMILHAEPPQPED